MQHVCVRLPSAMHTELRLWPEHGVHNAAMHSELLHLCVLFPLRSLIKGRVYLWQCALLVLGYVSYVSLTIWLSRKQQRVQLDPLYHEVPRLVPFGPWVGASE
jgi:Ca2+/Na+ antiporter